MRTSSCLIVIAATLSPSWSASAATCPASPIYVGTTSGSTQCKAADVQAAIDMACTDTEIVVTAGPAYTAEHITIQDKAITHLGTANTPKHA